MLAHINSNFRNSGRCILRCSVFTFISLFCILAIFKSPAVAQGPTSGSFVGVVRDNAGKGIPNAQITIKNQSNGFEVFTTSDRNGNYSKTALPPGRYEITVEAQGFQTKTTTEELYATRPNEVLPPIVLEAVVALPPPTPTPVPDNVVTPTPVPTPEVDKNEDRGSREVVPPPFFGPNISRNPRRDGAFNEFAVRTLPLGGTTLTRTFDELAFLVPGVAPPPQAIGNTVGPGIGGGVGTSGQFSVNGLRSRANNFTVDGSDNNDEDIGVRRQGFFTLVPQPIESTQEFTIITLLAPAEFGRNLGAQVNVNSKGGGNKFHGSIFGLANADFLNARNFFDSAGGDSSTTLQSLRSGNLVDVCFTVPDNVAPGDAICPVANNRRVTNDAGEKDVFSLLQGGFAVGGRIIRDKLFFFASGEGQVLNATTEKHFAVPTVEQRGLFDSGTIGLQQCQPRNNDPVDSTARVINGNCTLVVNGTPTMQIPFTSGFPTSAGGDAVFSLFPFPNNPRGIFGRNTYTQALSADARGGVLSGRVDYNFDLFNNRPQVLTARYNYTDDRRDLTDVGGAIFSAIRPLVRTDNFSSFLSGSVNNDLSNELRFSWGRTRLKFEELRDSTGFLLPISSSRITNAEERRFLLNAPILFNATIPTNCNITGCPAAPFTLYQVSNLTTAGNPISGLGEIGQLVIGGFSPVGVDVFNFPQQRVNDTFQIADTLRWQFNANGQHSLAFGADIRRVYLDSNLPRNSRPLVTFYGGGSADFDANGNILFDTFRFVSPQTIAGAGAAGGFFQSIAASGENAEIDLSYNQFNFFVQDEWRVSSKFNFIYGLRYEYNTTPKEAERKIEDTFGQQFFPTGSFNPLSGLNDFIDGRSNIYDGDRNNFAPRIGFAYAPTTDTVIRGGFGIYYDQIIGAVVSQSRNVFPNFTTANFGGGLLADNGGIFTLFNPRNAVFDPMLGWVCNTPNPRDLPPPCDPGRSIPLLQPGSLNTFNSAINPQQLQAALRDIYFNFPTFNGNAFGATLPTRNLDTPLSYQYSIGVEQELSIFGQHSIISAAYVGTTGRELLRYTTPNLGSNFLPLINSIDLVNRDPRIIGSTVDPFSNRTTFTRPNPDIGPINQFETTGRSRYDSLQIELRGRLTQNFQYRANYVYGKVKDDVSDVFDLAGAFALPQNSNPEEQEGEYAPANFDVRHRFTYSFIYDLPDFRNQNTVIRYLLGGWQIAGTGRFNTGQPFTVNSIYDVNLDGNLTDRLNNTQFITETGDRRQPLRLTGTSQTDLQAMLAQIGRDGSIPRNSFRAGNVLELDMSFARRFSTREAQNLEVRFDVFNFINRANFGIPVRILEFPSFGQATETITPGRRIQLMLRYNF